MPASAVFVMDLKGKIIISRNYRGDIPMSAADRFAKHLNEDDEGSLTPIITDDGVSYVYVKHNNIYVMAMTKYNANAMLLFSFLCQFVRVLEEYYNVLNEESIRDNFVITYELFDEMMDFGYPQFTEGKILKEYIMVQEKHLQAKPATQPPTALTNAVSWRGEGIFHKKNEIFLDVVEKLNILVSQNGTVLSSEIIGQLQMRSFLSGMPELKLGLNDKVLLQSTGGRTKGVDLEDIRFHQCVRLSRFENDRTISFIPPDGEFTLMSYRLNANVRPLISVEVHVERFGTTRVEYVVKARSNFKRRSTANDVTVLIPVPSDASSPSFKASIGRVEYLPASDSIAWRIKQFPGLKENIMRVMFNLPSVQSAEATTTRRAPISVSFEIPYYTVSGISVRYLKITEKSGYPASPWVRYVTRNGDYQIRMA